MRILGVVDLRGGRAVHAVGGVRNRYQPVPACGDIAIDGDPIALASAYRDALHVPEIYVADIDAISGEEPQDRIVDALIELGMPVWIDAGISTWQKAQEVINRGIARVVVGLETLQSFEALDVICISIGGQRVVFSLDMKNGVPILAAGSGLRTAGTSPAALAARAAKAGVGAIIALDLARVGLGGGVDLEMLRSVRKAAPDVMLLAGGGVRGEEDMAALAEAGADGILAATMLQETRRQ